MIRVTRVLMPVVLIMALLIPLTLVPSGSVSPASASSPVSVASARTAWWTLMLLCSPGKQS